MQSPHHSGFILLFLLCYFPLLCRVEVVSCWRASVVSFQLRYHSGVESMQGTQRCDFLSFFFFFPLCLWRRCRLRAPASCCCPEREKEMAPMGRWRRERGLGKSPDVPWWVSCHGAADSLRSIHVQTTLTIYTRWRILYVQMWCSDSKVKGQKQMTHVKPQKDIKCLLINQFTFVFS